LEVVSWWLRSASSCRSGGGLTVVQLRGPLADLEVVSRWCSFAVVRGLRNKLRGGFADLRPISLSPNVARYGTDSFSRQSRFAGPWWSVVVLLKLWLGFAGLCGSCKVYDVLDCVVVMVAAKAIEGSGSLVLIVK
ncbi:hypothetical protein FCV25MIE_04772, partial [Fagus crenata]